MTSIPGTHTEFRTSFSDGYQIGLCSKFARRNHDVRIPERKLQLWYVAATQSWSVVVPGYGVLVRSGGIWIVVLV